MSGQEDAEGSRRDYRAAYTPKKTIPTVQKYREEKAARKEGAQGTNLNQSQTPRASSRSNEKTNQNDHDGDQDELDKEGAAVDTSEANPVALDAGKRRKGKGRRGTEDPAEREVTDPVTHLPVKIWDFNSEALKDVDENPPPYGTTTRTSTGLANKTKSDQQLREETDHNQDGHDSMKSLFPPPSYDSLRRDLIKINKLGSTVGLAGSVVVILGALGLEKLLRVQVLARFVAEKGKTNWLLTLGFWIILGTSCLGGIWGLIAGVRTWMANRIDDVWNDHVWEANQGSQDRDAETHETESVSWLNTLLSSVWPLVNPDLFTSLADMLEDVMQASLPKLVQMVAVEDIGQGSESVRILGIRWLPTGAASRSVGADGKLESAEASKHGNDRKVSGEGEMDDAAKDKDDKNDDDKAQQSSDGTDKQVTEGMEAEEGDFINLEIAFAYRARTAESSLKARTKDMHLYLAFYLPGNLKIPVWVNVRGIVGTARVRLQLAPDPPFFGLCTITFLGQPKVDIGCIPIVKHGLNIMDLPLISNFVQSSIDAAMAEYVAPKSLTLDLKDLLAGDDFKKDTDARGVLVVRIKHGYDFKMGDASIPLISDGGADPYVSVGWAKFGKPLWSTRVMTKEMEPSWEETAYLPVTPMELNVDERIRVQLWDSDRFTADDDLGRIEVDLKQLMKQDASNGKMCDRTDGFKALKGDEKLPGKLAWSVGYFSKCRIQKGQFEKQTFDPDVRSFDQLKRKVDEISENKLREMAVKKGRHTQNAQELEQDKAREMKERQDAMIISAPPPEGYPSGIFSIQIHQITGLELEKLRKNDVDDAAQGSDEQEQGGNLPSAYCDVIVNHNKVFQTRTKPKNARPFYNAGTERFIADWRTADVFLSVRDARVDEDDPLLGIVHLPLGEVFKDRAQVNGFYPLSGGVAYGRVRISMVWRSVELQAPPESRGWHMGTLEVQPTLSSSDIPSDLKGLTMKFYTNIGSGKMYPSKDEDQYAARKQRSLKMGVHARYSSCLAIRLKRHGIIHDKTAAFAILWLKDVPDDQDRELTLPLWTGNYERARVCCLEQPGEKVGSITLKLKFWSGLGDAHAKWANRDPNLRDIVEVLDTAGDNDETREMEDAAGITDGEGNDTSDSDNSSDDSDDDDNNRSAGVDGSTNRDTGKSQGNGPQKMNLIDQARDYKKNAQQKNRQNRGVMQYKMPRTAQWAVHKVERAESKIADIFRRHSREPGVETEV